MLLLPSLRPSFVLHASHSPLSTGIFLVEFLESVLQKHLVLFIIFRHPHFGKQGPWFLACSSRLLYSIFLPLYIILAIFAPLSICRPYPNREIAEHCRAYSNQHSPCALGHCLASQLFLSWIGLTQSLGTTEQTFLYPLLAPLKYCMFSRAGRFS